MSESSSTSLLYTGTRESNGVIQALLTDLYQITMAYAYWKSGKMNDTAVFDLYFRRNPFQGEFTLFAGLEECVKLLENFCFSESDVAYIKKVMPKTVEEEFFQYLSGLTANKVILLAVDEGTVVFPRIPLLIVEGPLAVVQLLETPLLNLVNYASLVATNAKRFRIAAGPQKILLEFGLRRAQGPDGGLSASRYCYMGGFDGTSNVLAGKMFGIPVRGTHGHAFVTSYSHLKELGYRMLKTKDGSTEVDFVNLCLDCQKKLSSVMSFLRDQVVEGELASFIAYAQAFPQSFLALIDTYDVIRSGLPNFCTVALALYELGYQAQGIRLDSGDLAYLSSVVRNTFCHIATELKLPWFATLTIVASNDINEDTIHSLNTQGHHIDSFGIGTHLVTCQKQPALGCVFKMVQINDRPTMKLSEDVDKVTIPGKKQAYRLYGADGTALVDLLLRVEEDMPALGERLLCRHPTQESKRAYVYPARVDKLHHEYWRNGQVVRELPHLADLRKRACESMQTIRQDHKRALNPTPYKDKAHIDKTNWEESQADISDVDPNYSAEEEDYPLSLGQSFGSILSRAHQVCIETLPSKALTTSVPHASICLPSLSSSSFQHHSSFAQSKKSLSLLEEINAWIPTHPNTQYVPASALSFPCTRMQFGSADSFPACKPGKDPDIQLLGLASPPSQLVLSLHSAVAIDSHLRKSLAVSSFAESVSHALGLRCQDLQLEDKDKEDILILVEAMNTAVFIWGALF